MLNLPRGILIPLLTPFLENGEVDLPLLKALTQFYVDAGVHGLFVLGSAGQGPAMRPDQRRTALEAILGQTEGKVPVIAHVGTVDAYTAADLARHAAQIGASAIAIVPPFYYSDHTEFEVFQHYCEVAAAAPELPVVVYDNPQYAGIGMSPLKVAKLRGMLPAVQGIKLAFAGLDAVLRYVQGAPEHFRVYSGSVAYLQTGVPLGLSGCINPPSSMFPVLCVELWKSLERNDWEEASWRQGQLIRVAATIGAYVQRFGRGASAEVMRWCGFPVMRYPRWTTEPMRREDRVELRERLEALGIGPYFVEPLEPA